MENFNLKKFLVENNLTTNSRLLNESVSRATFYKGLKQELADVEVEKEDIQAIIDPNNGLGKFEEGKWIQSGMESQYRKSHSDADELDGIIAEYCDSIGVEFVEEGDSENTDTLKENSGRSPEERRIDTLLDTNDGPIGARSVIFRALEAAVNSNMYPDFKDADLDDIADVVLKALEVIKDNGGSLDSTEF